jgi:hypothetical protein
LRVRLKGGRDLAAELALAEKLEEAEDSAPVPYPDYVNGVADEFIKSILRYFDFFGSMSAGSMEHASQLIKSQLFEALGEVWGGAVLALVADKMISDSVAYAEKVDSRAVTADGVEAFAAAIRRAAEGKS